jgi:hypothetical protein
VNRASRRNAVRVIMGVRWPLGPAKLGHWAGPVNVDGAQNQAMNLRLKRRGVR